VLLQHIRVLSVGEALTVEQDDKAIRMQNITVAVTPEQALLVALAKQVGLFYLALRNPGDDAAVTDRTADVDALIGAPPALPAAKAAPSRPPPAPAHRIEMILGAETSVRTIDAAPARGP